MKDRLPFARSAPRAGKRRKSLKIQGLDIISEIPGVSIESASEVPSASAAGRTPKGRGVLVPIPSNDFGVEIGGHPSFDAILDRRIATGLIVVKREKLPNGRERVTYGNVMP